MIEQTKEINATKYRRAFLLTLFALVAVVVIAAWLWWQSPFNPFMHPAQQAATGSTAGQPSQAAIQGTNTDDSAASPADTPLAPIQLSPQRMQSIGAKIVTVEPKTNNE